MTAPDPRLVVAELDHPEGEYRSPGGSSLVGFASGFMLYSGPRPLFPNR